MLTDPGTLLTEFGEAANGAAIEGWPCSVRVETLPAPHQRPPLPTGEAAVYTFALSAGAGRSAPCGPGTVLRVGHARANDEQGFRNWHYNPHANAFTLAASLLAYPILWPWLGITSLDAASVGDWMLASLDRTHFFIPFGHPRVRDALEAYLRGRAGSVFDGLAGAARPYHMAAPGMWA